MNMRDRIATRIYLLFIGGYETPCPLPEGMLLRGFNAMKKTGVADRCYREADSILMDVASNVRETVRDKMAESLQESSRELGVLSTVTPDDLLSGDVSNVVAHDAVPSKIVQKQGRMFRVMDGGKDTPEPHPWTVGWFNALGLDMEEGVGVVIVWVDPEACAAEWHRRLNPYCPPGVTFEVRNRPRRIEQGETLGGLPTPPPFGVLQEPYARVPVARKGRFEDHRVLGARLVCDVCGASLRQLQGSEEYWCLGECSKTCAADPTGTSFGVPQKPYARASRDESPGKNEVGSENPRWREYLAADSELSFRDGLKDRSYADDLFDDLLSEAREQREAERRDLESMSQIERAALRSGYALDTSDEDAENGAQDVPGASSIPQEQVEASKLLQDGPEAVQTQDHRFTPTSVSRTCVSSICAVCGKDVKDHATR